MLPGDLNALPEILASISATKQDVSDVVALDDNPGIYIFYHKNGKDLGLFGGKDRTIYVGISEKSLNSRDLLMHLKTGETGWSTLRRSLGAVLKRKLQLIAIPRDENPKKLRPDKYKFSFEGEETLTKWMKKHLAVGFWATKDKLLIENLRILEEQLILQLKPSLDLDKRTVKFNPLAPELDALRAICRAEVRAKAHI